MSLNLITMLLRCLLIIADAVKYGARSARHTTDIHLKNVQIAKTQKDCLSTKTFVCRLFLIVFPFRLENLFSGFYGGCIIHKCRISDLKGFLKVMFHIFTG